MLKSKNENEQVANPQLKNISIVGYSAIDITVLTAIAMHKIGYNVLIVDLSPERDIVDGTLQGTGTSCVERYGVFASLKYDAKCDFCITYYGRNIDGARQKNEDQIRILTTDMYAEHARILSVLPSAVEPSLQVILLNEFAKIKYGEKFLLSLIDQKEVKKIYKLYYNTKDLEVKLSIGCEKVCLRNLTESYKRVLNEIISMALGQNLTNVQIKQIYSN